MTENSKTPTMEEIDEWIDRWGSRGNVMGRALRALKALMEERTEAMLEGARLRLERDETIKINAALRAENERLERRIEVLMAENVAIREAEEMARQRERDECEGRFGKPTDGATDD